MNQCSLVNVIDRIGSKVKNSSSSTLEALGGDDTRVGRGCTQPLHFRGFETAYIHPSGRAGRQIEAMRVQDIC